MIFTGMESEAHWFDSCNQEELVDVLDCSTQKKTPQQDTENHFELDNDF